jgi:hypothetical protein
MRHLGLWLILFGVVINRFCSFPIFSGVYFDPFPFYDVMYDGRNVGINLQSYIYMFANHLSIIAIWVFCRYEMPKYAILFSLFIVLEIGSLADFILIYEHPIFHIGNYGVEFTDFKLILYTSLIILWKHGKL